MWIYTTRGFVSVVADNDDPNLLLVRGRFRGDVEAVFPGAKVSETPDADYRFRACVDRVDAAVMIAAIVGSISYANFKNAAQKKRHGLLTRIWYTLYQEQDLEASKRRRRKKRRTMMVHDDPWAGLPLYHADGSIIDDDPARGA